MLKPEQAAFRKPHRRRLSDQSQTATAKQIQTFFFFFLKDVLLLATAYRGSDYISERLDSSLKGRKAGG